MNRYRVTATCKYASDSDLGLVLQRYEDLNSDVLQEFYYYGNTESSVAAGLNFSYDSTISFVDSDTYIITYEQQSDKDDILPAFIEQHRNPDMFNLNEILCYCGEPEIEGLKVEVKSIEYQKI